MTKLTSAKVPFVWTKVEDSAFHAIKNTLLNAPNLAHPDHNLPFIVESDASNFALGAVLLQKQADGLEHPVAFSLIRCFQQKPIMLFMIKNSWLL